MTLNATFYGSLVESAEYFATRLHEWAWSSASVTDRTNALIAARRLIDGLNFKGHKNSVYVLLEANEDATVAEIQAAEATQANEFPRGADTVVPEDIRIAQYELAHSLLDNKDAELELETLAVTGQTYGGVKTTYQRDQTPIEHLVNMIPNAVAWRLIRPYLRDGNAIEVSRVS
jgi:MoxR-like ATPase